MFVLQDSQLGALPDPWKKGSRAMLRAHFNHHAPVWRQSTTLQWSENRQSCALLLRCHEYHLATLTYCAVQHQTPSPPRYLLCTTPTVWNVSEKFTVKNTASLGLSKTTPAPAEIIGIVASGFGEGRAGARWSLGNPHCHPNAWLPIYGRSEVKSCPSSVVWFFSHTSGFESNSEVQYEVRFCKRLGDTSLITES